MNRTPLHLFGTIHRDPDGDRALTAMLVEHAPRCITVEIAPYSIDFRQRHGVRLLEVLERLLPAVADRLERPLDALLRDARIEVIRATLELPYEYTAAQRYGETHGVPVHAIDDDERARARLEALEHHFLTVEGLAAYLEGAPDFTSAAARANEQFSLARRYVRVAGTFAYHYRSEEIEDMAARAEVMARTLESLWASLDENGAAGAMGEGATARAEHAGESDGAFKGGLIHIGGWEQLVRTEKIANLISRLARLNPQVKVVG